MKKVGIVTLSYSINFGAQLQCYALRKTINSFNGFSADILNLIPTGYKFPLYAEPELNGQFLEQLSRFHGFQRSFLGMRKDAVDEGAPDIWLGYDFLIAGSDQIWNPSFAARDAHFLNCAPKNTVKISYAASIGKPVPEITSAEAEKFRRFIPAFDFLSLREREHEDFIRQFTDKKVTTVLDPTLLLDSSGYDEIISRKSDGKYIMLYILNYDSTLPNILSFVNKVSIKYDLPVRHNLVKLPSFAIKNQAESYCFAGVEEFLGIAKGAEMIITNSFHGTIFSILFGKPFYTFIVSNMASRIYNMLSALGLSRQIVDSYKPLSDVSSALDLSGAFSLLEGLRDHSLAFLKTSLGFFG